MKESIRDAILSRFELLGFEKVSNTGGDRNELNLNCNWQIFEGVVGKLVF